MARIIEVQDSKIDNLTRYAEELANNSKKLLMCLQNINDNGYMERYGRPYDYPRYL